MKWNLTYSVNDFHQWSLNEDQLKVGLRYNSEAHTLRVHSDDKRLFFLERTGGVLQSRILLRTDYSVEIGEAYFEKNRHSGQMVLNEKKYSFKVDGSYLKLYNREKKLVFEIDIADIDNLELFEFSALLFGTGIVTNKFGMKLQPAV